MEELKKWTCLSCVVCGFRYSPRRFIRNPLEPIRFPAQTVTGGGRAKGFHVERYTPWSEVTSLKEQPEVWRALNCEYVRLSFAYDAFYDHLHFLSPRMLEIIDSLNNEIHRLRITCRDLQERLDRLLLTHRHGSDSIGREFGRILEEITRRDEQDRSYILDLIN